jgi:preprotein translocase subunit YajC
MGKYFYLVLMVIAVHLPIFLMIRADKAEKQRKQSSQERAQCEPDGRASRHP